MGHGGDNENDGDDTVGPTERCASNLFDRFAARPQPNPARESKKTLSCGPGTPEAAAETSERAVTAGSAAERDKRDKDRDEDADEDRNEDREVLKAAGFGDGPKVVRGAGGGGRGRALSELSVNSVATRSAVACREGFGVSLPSPVGKGKEGGSPGQEARRAMGGSGESVSQACGRRRGRVQEDVGKGGARAVCGGDDGDDGSKYGRSSDAHGKLCSGRRNKSAGAEGVRDSHGGGGGGGGDLERPSEHTGSRLKKEAGGGSGGGGGLGVVDGGDLFMRFMYNA